MKKRNKCPACQDHGWRVFTTITGDAIHRCDECRKFKDDRSAIANARFIGITCDDLGYISRNTEFKDENEIFLITPFKREDVLDPSDRTVNLGRVWVFNDPLRGLMMEPFVDKINDMIDWMVRDIPMAEKGFNLFFSASQIPNATISLERVDDGFNSTISGATYRCRELNVDGWLCPALLRYFEEPPQQLFGAAVALKAQKPKQTKEEGTKSNEKTTSKADNQGTVSDKPANRYNLPPFTHLAKL